MPRRSKGSRLLRYGYWAHPDPIPSIRKLLAKRQTQLEEFDSMIEEEVCFDDFAAWAARHDLPARVRKLVSLGQPTGTLFGEVVIASGSGPDMGGMVSWNSALLARRRDGQIRYRVDEDGVRPIDSRKPLDEDAVYECVMGDPYYPHLDDVIEAYLDGAPTLETVERAIDAWASTASVDSDFYDLCGRWRHIVEGVKQAARERFEDESRE